MSTLPKPCFCLVTDRRRLVPDARTLSVEIARIERQADEALQAGIDMIQVRERDLDARVLRDLTVRLVSLAAGRALILVNDRADVALAAGAAGVHLRADGPAVLRVRTLGPDGWVIGRSIHTPAEAAEHAGADYLLFGTVQPTASKPAGHRVAGIAGLEAAVRSAAGTPVLAIGGLTPRESAACREAGAAGVAATGAFLGPSRAAAVREFRDGWITR